MPKQTNTKKPEGLIGLFGHTIVVDPDNKRRLTIECQFEIIGKMAGERYVVQYFSWLHGGADKVGVMSEAELLGDKVRLYTTAALWQAAADRDWEQWDRSRGMTK